MQADCLLADRRGTGYAVRRRRRSVAGVRVVRLIEARCAAMAAGMRRRRKHNLAASGILVTMVN